MVWFRTLEEVLRNIHTIYQPRKEEIEIIKKAVPAIWKLKELKAFQLLQNVCNDLTKYYKIPPITVKKSKKYAMCYCCRVIYLKKPSLFGFLHEFRHFLQKDLFIYVFGDIELDANVYASSIFYKIAPKTFLRAWKSGKIKPLDPMFCPEKEEAPEII